MTEETESSGVDSSDNIEPRGEFEYESPVDGIIHHFKTEKERVDFIEEQNARDNRP